MLATYHDTSFNYCSMEFLGSLTVLPSIVIGYRAD